MQNERLTIRNSDGSVSQPTDLRWADALSKLAYYEDLGMTMEELQIVAKANRDGRLKLSPDKCSDYCGTCIHYHHEFGSLSGTCDARIDTDRRTGEKIPFALHNSRVACKEFYEKRENDSWEPKLRFAAIPTSFGGFPSDL